MQVNGQLHVLAVLPPGNNPRSHSIGGWMGPRTSLDILEKRKISCLSRIQIPDNPAQALITLHYHSCKLMLDFIYSSLQDTCGQQDGPTDESGLQAKSG